jgi:hypothetical protein
VKFQHGGQRYETVFETKRKQRGRKVIIHEIPLSEHAKSLEDSNSQMIQIVVYLQSLLRQVLFTHIWIGGSKYPTIL